MKRIEDITVDDMEDVVRTGWAQAMNRCGRDWTKEGMDDGNAKGIAAFVLDYIKVNLDTGKRETMSVEEIEKRLRSDWMTLPSVVGEMNNSLAWNGLARAIQPLTVQQGFVPDWPKAPEYANSVKWHWSRDTDGGNVISTRPAPKMRQKTREEKIADLRSNAVIMNWPTIGQLKDDTIDDLCRAASIPLETEE